MLLTDRNFNTAFFHLLEEVTCVVSAFILVFWTSEVYILILLVLELLVHCYLSKSKTIFGYLGMIYAWFQSLFRFYCLGHHMYTVGMDVDTRAYFTARQ
jgi:cytochrome c oxidase subunit I